MLYSLDPTGKKANTNMLLALSRDNQARRKIRDKEYADRFVKHPVELKVTTEFSIKYPWCKTWIYTRTVVADNPDTGYYKAIPLDSKVNFT